MNTLIKILSVLVVVTMMQSTLLFDANVSVVDVDAGKVVVEFHNHLFSFYGDDYAIGDQIVVTFETNNLFNLQSYKIIDAQ